MSREPEVGIDQIPRLGAMLGRYRLDAVIGRGGMGVVFRAVDDDLDRTVAIKVLAHELASDPQVRERFIREGRLAAAIEHPHIVPVYEAASASGVDYIAMRFIPGSDLSRILRREAPLDAARVLAICGQLADALDAAHARGLIHRDVKPGNVLLEDLGEEWAWLTDFGLTKRLGASMPPTRDGLVGTIEYMAPEAIEHGMVDGRSDQYALACLTYHCLTGVPPFDGDSEARVLHGHLHDDPPLIAGRVDGVASGVDAVIRRALAKDPADRFSTCRAFATELRRVSVDDGTADREVAGSAALIGPAGGPARASPGRPGRSRGLVPVTSARRRYLVGTLVLAGAVGGSVYMAGWTGGGYRDLGLPPMSAALDSAPAASAPATLAVGLTGPDGVIVFAGDAAGNFDIWAVRPDGTGLSAVTTDPRSERAPSVSADGSKVVFTVGPNGKRDLYLANGDGSGRTRLTTSAADEYAPAISPDGRSIVWVAERSGHKHLWLMTDGGDGFDERRAEDITDDPTTDWNHDADDPAWFPDSRQVAFSSNRAESPDIWSVNVNKEWRPEQWTTDLRRDFQPTVGPDESIVFVREMTLGGDRFLFSATAGEPNPRVLTKAVRNPTRPDFSPDGAGLVVARDADASGFGLLTMSTDGSHRRPVRIEMANATDPDWVASLGTP